MQVENNQGASVKNTPKEPMEDPGDGQDPTPPPELEREGVNPHQQYLRKIFSTKKGIRQKLEQKDYPAKAGQVDKVLKR